MTWAQVCEIIPYPWPLYASIMLPIVIGGAIAWYLWRRLK